MTQIETPAHGGNDPDDMNQKRAEWGLKLTDRIRYLTGTEKEDAVCDAIADLLHAAHAMGQDPAQELSRAVYHFNAETGEEGGL